MSRTVVRVGLLIVCLTASCSKSSRKPEPTAAPAPPGASAAPGAARPFDCEAMKAHVSRLLEVKQADMDPARQACAGVTLAEFHCVMAAQTASAVFRCGPDGNSAQDEMDKIHDDAKKYFDNATKP